MYLYTLIDAFNMKPLIDNIEYYDLFDDLPTSSEKFKY